MDSHDEKTREPQYQGQIELRDAKGLTPLGYTTNLVWHSDPRRVGFILARYKFVAKMLEGKSRVFEVGCGDAFGARIVLQGVKHLTVSDFDPLFIEDVKQRMEAPWIFETLVHDMLDCPVPGQLFDAAYSLDVLEHISAVQEQRFLGNICASLVQTGVLIIGTPSLEGQQYASVPSKAGHINCKSQEELRSLMLHFFENVFVFGMNDEVVHTGYGKMAHYLFAIGAGKKS